MKLGFLIVGSDMYDHELHYFTAGEYKSNHFETFQNENKTNFNYSTPKNKPKIRNPRYYLLPPPQENLLKKSSADSTTKMHQISQNFPQKTETMS